MSDNKNLHADLHPDVRAQLDELPMETGRPLVVTDADEVLFAFMAGLEAYLETQDLYFDWSSFALTGNIRRRADQTPLPGEVVKSTLGAFFASSTESLAAVPGAADALRNLHHEGVQIVVLSNLPLEQIPARKRALARHGMDYPLIANIGSKGAAVRHLAEQADAPAVFLDDIPHHHTAVAAVAEHVLRLHFVADPRLAKLLGPAEHSHHRADDWPSAHRLIERHLFAQKNNRGR